MSQFLGNKTKVRCTDCTKYSFGRCMAKGIKTTPKKKRTCEVYEFKGMYENRTPIPSIYSPYVDRKTRKTIKRLLNLGIIPINAPLEKSNSEDYEKVKTLPMPSSTATSNTVPEEDMLVRPVERSDALKDGKLIWMPGDA